MDPSMPPLPTPPSSYYPGVPASLPPAPAYPPAQPPVAYTAAPAQMQHPTMQQPVVQPAHNYTPGKGSPNPCGAGGAYGSCAAGSGAAYGRGAGCFGARGAYGSSWSHSPGGRGFKGGGKGAKGAGKPDGGNFGGMKGRAFGKGMDSGKGGGKGYGKGFGKGGGRASFGGRGWGGASAGDAGFYKPSFAEDPWAQLFPNDPIRLPLRKSAAAVKPAADSAEVSANVDDAEEDDGWGADETDADTNADTNAETNVDAPTTTNDEGDSMVVDSTQTAAATITVTTPAATTIGGATDVKAAETIAPAPRAATLADEICSIDELRCAASSLQASVAKVRGNEMACKLLPIVQSSLQQVQSVLNGTNTTEEACIEGAPSKRCKLSDASEEN